MVTTTRFASCRNNSMTDRCCFPNEKVDDISIATISAFLAPTADFGDNSCSSSSFASSAPPTSPTTTITKQRYMRPKQEIDALRITYAKLRRQLHLLETRLANVPAAALPWQTRAIEQAKGVQQAMHENLRLKNMVTERAQVIETLQSVLTKHPSILVDDGSWMLGTLGAHDRTQHLEQLLRAQYDKRSREWVRHGLYDVRHACLEQHRAFVDCDSDETLSLVCLLSRKVPLSVHDMSHVLWSLKSRPADNRCAVLQTFHDNLIYVREMIPLPPPASSQIEVRTALRRYVESDDSVVFAWRAIADDRLHPIDAHHVIGQREGWTTIHAVDGGAFVQVCVQLSLPARLVSAETLPTETLNELVLQTIEANCARFCSQLDGAMQRCLRQKAACA
ncbi:hypothetical protein SDRG_16180 [Saprolegnia diclina VS20]|uniref:START domain-containing protein n=1 Tax=Saprolegnia diclina (strain VS20) TaxID=1156394 RepID=T0R924_SAPDV|nr:hypothetical protein SDRG_16180 [Saprolegnia diclina VS20]EQC25962.1 hypothetical protein SDRG_16180 [Saprolegnia diclina VS20]|eukprot:XP_008620601.1 hypothetical protein SDRG_16180 [Saprolegnia diclina VS20]